MNPLDMRTIVISYLVTSIACVLFVVLLWRQNRSRFAGTAFWVVDFVFQAAALVLIVMRGAIPDWSSMVLSNTLVIVGAILGFVGLERFMGKNGPQIHNYLLVILFIFVHSYFALVQPNLAVRNLNLAVALMLICFQSVWLVWRRVEPALRSLAFGVGAVNFLYCLVSSARIVHFFIVPHVDSNYFLQALFEALVLVSYQVLFILLTYSFVLMVNKRLLMGIATQEEKFSKAFHSAPYAIVITRPSDETIIDVNETFSSLTGYDRTEVMGKKTKDLHIWEHDEDRAAVVDVLSRKGGVHGMEISFRKKNGEGITGLFSAEVITIDGEKKILSSIGDITDRKQAEEQLQNLNINLQKRVDEETGRRLAQERVLADHTHLAAMGKMIGAIAHQWRQPLSTLGMIVQRLHAAGTLQGLTREQLDEFKAKAMRQVKYMSDTIDEFRNFYLPEKEKKPFQPHACIADAVRLFDAQFTSHGITVDLVCPEEAHHFINGYPNEFKQAILNLLGNARDAILDCRAVHGKPEEGQILFNIFITLENVMIIDVSDNGCGISADIATQIFDPYFTTKEESGGSGIGLYMSRMIVEDKLKGRLSLMKGEGEGATFRIELPLEEE